MVFGVNVIHLFLREAVDIIAVGINSVIDLVIGFHECTLASGVEK